MKVYVVCQEWRDDCEEGKEVEIFSTKEKAKAYFNKELEQLKTYYHVNEKDELGEYGENKETKYSAQSAYYYCYSKDDKFDIWIEEREVL